MMVRAMGFLDLTKHSATADVDGEVNGDVSGDVSGEDHAFLAGVLGVRL
jgi:hypothetical protein